MGWTGRGKAGEHHVGKQLMGSACNGQNVPVLLLSGMFYQRAKVWEMPKCRNALASPCKALLALDGAESSQLCPKSGGWKQGMWGEAVLVYLGCPKAPKNSLECGSLPCCCRDGRDPNVPMPAAAPGGDGPLKQPKQILLI